mmetsp:Transcript_53/g.185  ORF Transcript_53/g.185 Transcript_53/m.185 type:complete len:202 (-) Transcript_53:18-623(-)
MFPTAGAGWALRGRPFRTGRATRACMKCHSLPKTQTPFRAKCAHAANGRDTRAAKPSTASAFVTRQRDAATCSVASAALGIATDTSPSDSGYVAKCAQAERTCGIRTFARATWACTSWQRGPWGHVPEAAKCGQTKRPSPPPMSGAPRRFAPGSSRVGSWATWQRRSANTTPGWRRSRKWICWETSVIIVGMGRWKYTCFQ